MRYPFNKILLYLMALSKFDRRRFADHAETYLPSIVFEDDIYAEVNEEIHAVPTPGCIFSDTQNAMRIFSGIFKLTDLHAAFDNESFEDLVFDIDLRRRIDAMMLSSVFRPIDVIKEFPQFNELILKTYIDCFANFANVSIKNLYVAKLIGDNYEKKLLEKVLKTTSRNHLKIVLGLKCQELRPMDVLHKSLNIAQLKTDIALLDDDDAKLEKWTKLSVSVAEQMHRMGAGSQSDLDRLIETLQAEPDYEDPVIYTKEQLEDKFKENENEQK